MAGTLYVVATPIGNLGDVSERAREVLGRVAHVVAEDTRRARQLLTHLGLGGRALHRVDAHATDADLERVVALLEAGEDVALTTDAGTPAVSDPGRELVHRAARAGLRVSPIPGPSAALAALVASGLASDRGFRFFGFLPRDGAARQEALGRVAGTPEPVILFESPRRARETLGELAAATPARPCAVARELTKVHEEIVRGRLDALAADDREWLGELVIVLGAHDVSEVALDDDALDAAIDAGLAEGLHARSLAERLAARSGRPRREVYERVVTRRRARQ